MIYAPLQHTHPPTLPRPQQAVTCLAFSDSGALLVTGGEDTLVNAWLLADVLDATAGQAMQVCGVGADWRGLRLRVCMAVAALISCCPPRSHLQPQTQTPRLLPGHHCNTQMGGPLLQPLASWSDHTLPVTCLAVGAGDAGAVVASGSLDRTVKLRRLTGGAGGGLLRSVPLPSPVHSLALDPGEHAIYAGTATGTIYQVSLVGGSAAGAGLQDGGAATAAGSCPHPAMEGHSQAVTCLEFTPDAAHLVSGSLDASVRVWELRSRQQVRLLQNPAKGPVSALLVLTQPPFMQASSRFCMGWCGMCSSVSWMHMCLLAGARPLAPPPDTSDAVCCSCSRLLMGCLP